MASGASANFHEVQSPEHFQSLLSEDLSRVSLINFWAPWAAPCAQMNEVVVELAKKYSQVLVLQVRMALIQLQTSRLNRNSLFYVLY